MKNRLEKDRRADKFLEVAKKRLDAVYKRISDCTDASRLYGADIYYHSACMRNYIRDGKSHGDLDISSPADVMLKKGRNVSDTSVSYRYRVHIE